MTAFRLTSTNDLALEGGRLVLVRGDEEKASKIRARLALWLGEWFIDTSEGVPWYGLVLGQKPDLAIVKRLVTTIILSVPGVATVDEMNATYAGDSREVDVTWRATSDSGEQISGGATPFRLALP